MIIIKVIAIFLSICKSGIDISEKLLIHGFGPRGLTSIVFVVMIMNKELPHKNMIALLVVSTILLSVILHGLSANPSVKLSVKQGQKK